MVGVTAHSGYLMSEGRGEPAAPALAAEAARSSWERAMRGSREACGPGIVLLRPTNLCCRRCLAVGRLPGSYITLAGDLSDRVQR